MKMFTRIALLMLTLSALSSGVIFAANILENFKEKIDEVRKSFLNVDDEAAHFKGAYKEKGNPALHKQKFEDGEKKYNEFYKEVATLNNSLKKAGEDIIKDIPSFDKKNIENLFKNNYKTIDNISKHGNEFIKYSYNFRKEIENKVETQAVPLLVALIKADVIKELLIAALTYYAEETARKTLIKEYDKYIDSKIVVAEFDAIEPKYESPDKIKKSSKQLQ